MPASSSARGNRWDGLDERVLIVIFILAGDKLEKREMPFRTGSDGGRRGRERGNCRQVYQGAQGRRGHVRCRLPRYAHFISRRSDARPGQEIATGRQIAIKKVSRVELQRR